MFNSILEFLQNYEDIFIILAWSSIVLFIVSLSIIPWIVIQLPSTYFQLKKRSTMRSKSKHPLIAQILTTMKNLLGFLLLVLGILMLVLPGQGILTILLGISMMNFPGKFKLERKLVSIPKVLNSLNWIRRKASKEPLII